ncbi:hypothetical protein BDL97_04G005500 [Sphagnum fallax]|nr:hypothetical protein BDL97_04G005500 [Sphagnum fallax]
MAASLQGKTAVVTGGSQGIGRQISLNLAKQGASVVVNYSSNKQKADEVVSQIESEHGKAIAAEETFGKVHIVVNCAGMVLYSYPTVAQASEEDWDRVYAVNTKGTFLASKEAALRIPPGEGGRIVKITTSLVATLLPNFAVYTSSKAAVETFTKILAKELRGTKITANLFLRGKTKAFIEFWTKEPPLERLGQPEDIAAVVSFNVSPEGEWINGQVIRANGGFVS